MAHPSSASQSFLALARSFKRLQTSDPLTQCFAPRMIRSYATTNELPPSQAPPPPPPIPTSTRSTTASTNPFQTTPTTSPFETPVLATIHSWPTLEPTRLRSYPASHLNLPLRRDILHRAVIYEADSTRQGTASTKHRTAVKGSSRKIRPQKGTGSARLSDRKSPSIRGGGVAHGPHPDRNFATELPKKIYDLAFRTALSYRYKKGELVIVEKAVNMQPGQGPRWLHNFFETHGWGRGNGRTFVVVDEPRDRKDESEVRSLGRLRQDLLMEAMEQVGEHAEVQYLEDVDVKDLLSCGRVIIEERALQKMLKFRTPQ